MFLRLVYISVCVVLLRSDVLFFYFFLGRSFLLSGFCVRFIFFCLCTIVTAYVSALLRRMVLVPCYSVLDGV